MTKPFDDISTLLGLIHTGDWGKSSAAVSAVADGPVPTDVRELSEYRRRLHDALVAARAARANLVTELARVQAGQRVSSAYQNGTPVPERSADPVPGGLTA